MGNPWENHGKSMENSMDNPWETHGKSMDNKNEKKEMFPWYSMGPHGGPWGPMGPHEESWVPTQQISCAPHPTNIVCATPKKYRVRHSNKIMFLRFCKVRCREKKGGWVPELFPTIPTCQNPIIINSGPLLCKVSWFFKNVENHDFNETHYSVRQKIGDPGSISIRNMFPLHPVTPKRLNRHMEQNICFWQKIKFFSLFPLSIGPLLGT